jgi:hypothetical protein
MSRRFLFAVSLILIGTTTLFAQVAGDVEGSKARDRKELVSGIALGVTVNPPLLNSNLGRGKKLGSTKNGPWVMLGWIHNSLGMEAVRW